MIGIFKKVATQYETTQGKSYSYGFHFRGSTVLPLFYYHPDVSGTNSAIGLTATTGRATSNAAPWPKALSGNHWDVVTMQPHGPISDMGPNNLIDNIVAINGMIDTARKNISNASTRFFIYAPWQNTSIFPRNYTAATINKVNPDSTPATPSRDFIELLCDRVRKTNPGVCVIPVGEVFYTLDSMMKQGKFDHFTSFNQLHRDVIHLNAGGQNIAAWTAYATIFQKSPVVLAYDAFVSGVNSQFTEVLTMNDHDRLLIQKTVWDVVTTMSKYTGVKTEYKAGDGQYGKIKPDSVNLLTIPQVGLTIAPSVLPLKVDE